MKFFISAVVMLLLSAVPSYAADHVVRMLNVSSDGTRMAFEPSFIRANPGDTVIFKPVDGGHAAASVIVPDGAETWEAPMNTEARVTVTAPGVYLFKSRPHFALGMIGMIVVDDANANRDAIEAFRPRGSLMRKRFEALKNQL